MPTTTLRIENELKARMGAAAARAGKTTHAFLVEAVAHAVAKDEADEELHRVADARWAKLVTSGRTIPWDEAKAYVTARSHGKRPRKPMARKPRR